MAQWLEALEQDAQQVVPSEPFRDKELIHRAEQLATGAHVLHLSGYGYRVTLGSRIISRLPDVDQVQATLHQLGIPLTGWCSSWDAKAPQRAYEAQEALVKQTYEQLRAAMLQALEQQKQAALKALAEQRNQHLADLAASLN